MTRTLHAAVLGLSWIAASSVAWALAPTTSDPNGRLIPGFNQPGVFPVTVSGANIDVAPLAGVEIDGAGEDFLTVQFPASGPIAWTSSRANSGDLAVSIGVADPANPLSFPANSAVENFQALNTNSNPINPNSTDLTTLAWRASYVTGALLATTRHNGVNDGYSRRGTGGAPAGEIQGVSYFVVTSGQGWGFRMTDGQFRNGGNGSSDLVTGHFGSAGGDHEASFNVAATYLPYEEGWKGAWVQAAANGPGSYHSAAPGIDASNVTWTNGQATVSLPGVDSATDGMLFVAPANGSSTTRLASAFPNGAGGWTTTVRLDDNADTTGQTILTSGNDFQFVYVPYHANNLIGGLVNGGDGSLVTSAGSDRVSITRTAAGDYSVSVFADDLATKKTESDGMFVLSNADTLAGSTTLGSRANLSYEYDPASGDFVIQARELVATSGGSDDGYGNDFDLIDTDFYFSWVDFATPLSLNEGDYNADGRVDAADYTVWRDGGATADGNGDGAIDSLDRDLWAANYGRGVTAAPSSGVSVPEPAALGLVFGLIAVGAGLRRR